MARLHATVLAQAAANDVGDIRANLRPRLTQTLIKLGPRLEKIYAAAAPKRSGKLAAEIRSRFLSPEEIEVISPVKSAEGFPYTGVTRFGHKSAYIYPRTARALRFEIGGRVIFARRVRGYMPATDWADTAFPFAQVAVVQAASDYADSL